MNISRYHKLTSQAANIMEISNDPIHDLAHVRRVVTYTERLCDDMKISGDRKEALILAAWWHDASRTLTKNPSIIWMPLVDDMLSALMLWIATIRHGFFGPVAGMACRAILCKSLGTGAIFSRIFMRKKNRILIDILEDADTLDVLHQERMNNMMSMVETSWVYKRGYKLAVNWIVNTSHMNMKTAQAQKYFQEILEACLTFLRDKAVFAWHVAQFGLKWTEQAIAKAEYMLATLTERNHSQALA